MAVTLYASNEGFMDDIDVTRILPFETELHQYMHQKHADLLNKIETTKDLDKDAEAVLKAAVTEFKKSWS
jgi:F-type H+/Na+-transporting ATPase subunit alpha